MNKRFYFFGIFLLALSIASQLLGSTIRSLLGNEIVFLESFPAWFFGVNIISLAGSLFILKYYHYKKYWFTFSAGTIATIASFLVFIIIYMQLVAWKMESYHSSALLFALATAILYAVSLVASNAGKKPWLKAAGIFMFILSLLLMFTLIWHMNFPNVQTNGTLEKINQLTSFTGALIPLLFIMNFSSEVKNVPATVHKSSEGLMGLVALAAFVFTLAFGMLLANESYSKKYWQNRNSEKTHKMAQQFEARKFVTSKGDTLLYLLQKPLDFDSNKNYPLVVSLPYDGYEGAAAAQLLSSDVNRRKYPAFLFVPYCPPGSGWGGIPGYPSVDSLVFETLDQLEEEKGIDAKKLYVTGVSKGGYGSWHFICTRPKMFAAAIPVCGGADPQLASNIVDVSVWAFHGKKDRNVPVIYSQNMIEAIKKAGGNPRYTEFPNTGHNIWEQVESTPGLLDWLFAQKRD